ADGLGPVVRVTRTRSLYPAWRQSSLRAAKRRQTKFRNSGLGRSRAQPKSRSLWSRYNAPKTPARACKSLRIRVAANTMAVKEGSTSFQPRVLSPQSGFTQI